LKQAHGWFDAKKEEKLSHGLNRRSVETPRSPCIAARSLAGPTSRRPCRRADLKEASNQPQYLRIPNKILKGTSHEEVVNDVVVEVMTSIPVVDEAMDT
jgi:hypothetical protein